MNDLWERAERGIEKMREWGCKIQTKAGTCYFEALRDNIIHCVCTKKEAVEESVLGITGAGAEETLMGMSGDGAEAAFTDKSHKTASLQVVENERELLLSTEELVLHINRENGAFLWENKDGNKLLKGQPELQEVPYITYQPRTEELLIRKEKTIDGERNFVENLVPVEDHKAYRGTFFFDFDDNEHIYGFGQGEEGIYDYRLQTQYLYQHNMRIPVPFFLSDKGYGILVDCGSLMTFEGKEKNSSLTLDCVEQLDYYFIYGEKFDRIIAGFRSLTGRASMLPKWAFGYIQSREAYHTQQELLEVAGEYRRRGLPLDCVVQDWNTWEPNCWGNKQVDKERYPDIRKMNEILHNMHVHSMISVWPTMSAGTTDYREMKDAGCLLADDTTYDAFSPKARDIYWSQLKRELYPAGFDAWWCDSTEPFSGPDWNGEEKRSPRERFRLVGEEHKKYLRPDLANLYATVHAKGIYEHQRKENQGKRVVNLTRSGYPSVQKYGTILWSGDICATWEVFRKQITEAINMGLSGMPYWTFDIGGFFTVNENWRHRGCFADKDSTPKWFWKGDYEEGVDDLGYRELYVRWFQMGAFLPMFRSHGTDTPREIWQFGNPGEIFYDALSDMLQLRYRLLPYIYSQAGMVWLKHGTMVRSLLFDYSGDEACKIISDEYMFGDTILVCPVTKPMYYGKNSVPLEGDRIRTCYLPKGNDWYDFYTGVKYRGGTTLQRETPLREIPLFVKAGAILPMEEKPSAYAGQEPEGDLEFHVYPGADGRFTYYEDGGDGYAYEEGAYQTIELTWADEEGLFTIGAAPKSFPGSLIGRRCVVCCGDIKQEFIYSGEAKSIQCKSKSFKN